jgi:hypothetical protein
VIANLSPTLLSRIPIDQAARSKKPNGSTLSTDPNSVDPCGTRISPRKPIGAMVVPSTLSPVWEMREPVVVDKRASKVVPAGKSRPQSVNESTMSIGHTSREYLRASCRPEWSAIVTGKFHVQTFGRELPPKALLLLLGSSSKPFDTVRSEMSPF